MLELATLALVGLVLVAVFVLFSVAAFLIQGIVWIVLLPFRLLLALLFIPILIVKFVIGGALMLVVAPIVALATLIGVLAAVIAIAIPLLPFVIVAWAVYILMRTAAPVPAR